MTDRDRLIELKTQFVENFNCGNCNPEEGKCKKCLTEKETDYLLANGVIVPPCKVGDTLYPIVDMSHTACKSFVSEIPIRVLPYQIYYINVMGGISAIPFDNFGKTIFLTKEEAEKALAERSEGE